jgi:hypothetical protein
VQYHVAYRRLLFHRRTLVLWLHYFLHFILFLSVQSAAVINLCYDVSLRAPVGTLDLFLDAKAGGHRVELGVVVVS